eukprot:6764613-Alexandrium_andersonii.AAC.1
MSASLVGSEMCIRDRACPRCRRGVPESVRPRGAEVGRLLEGGVGHSRGPVSYTHLTLPTICSV